MTHDTWDILLTVILETKMKIGLVCPYDMFRGGGVQEHVLAQAVELRKRGHTVKILTPRPRKNGEHPPANVIYVGNSTLVKTPISTSHEWGMAIDLEGIEELLASENFDLMHVHEPEVPIIGAQIIAKATCPVVATFHAIHPDTPMARTIGALRVPYARPIFSRLSAITAVSNVAAGFVKEHTHHEVSIIPNGIDLHKYDPAKANLKRQPDTILYIGRLEKRKGVKYLIKATAELQKKRPSVELIIAGSGPDRAKLEQLVKELKLSKVTFLGFVDEATKLELLASSSLFCSPALYGESFGIVLLEAMAMGVVIVAGNNPGYVSVMDGRGKISVVNPKDTEDFARRLELLLYDETLRKSWLNWSQKYVKQFDYKKVVDQYEALYKEQIKKNKKQ